MCYTMITHTKQGNIDPTSVVAFRADLWLLLGKVSDVHLHHVCARGYLPAVHVLAEQYPLNVRTNSSRALRAACHHGHLPTVVYLTEHCQLTLEDARARNNVALRGASINGHLPVVRYLAEHYGLTREDTQAARRLAHRHIVEYLDGQRTHFVGSSWTGPEGDGVQ